MKLFFNYFVQFEKEKIKLNVENVHTCTFVIVINNKFYTWL